MFTPQVHVYDYESEYAFHLWEAIAFFDQIETFVREPTDEDYAFRDEMQHIGAAFARLGDSTSHLDGGELNETRTDLALWPRVPGGLALVSTNITFVEAYNEEKCLFWESQGLTSYVWVS